MWEICAGGCKVQLPPALVDAAYVSPPCGRMKVSGPALDAAYMSIAFMSPRVRMKLLICPDLGDAAYMSPGVQRRARRGHAHPAKLPRLHPPRDH
eukprot:2032954-Rhodomonas_salina.1